MDPELSHHLKILQGVTSPDENIRHETDNYISQLLSNSQPKLVELSCRTILSEDHSSVVSVQLSFMLLLRMKAGISSNWGNFQLGQRDVIKKSLIKGILSPDPTIRNYASLVFSYVIEADKPYGIIPNLFDTITPFIINPEIHNQNKVGFVFVLKDLIEQKVISPETCKSDFAFNVYMQYLFYILSNIHEFENNLISIISCYNKIISFYEKRVNESNLKIQLISSVRTILHNEHFSGIYKCFFYFLFIIFRTCYSTINEVDMKEIFLITQETFSMPDPKLVISSILFWKEVANYEFQLIETKKRDNELGRENNTVINNFAENASTALLGPIIDFIIKNANEKPIGEGNGEEDICFEAVQTLDSFGKISPIVLEFIKANFEGMSTSEDWRVRYASICLLYCIKDSPFYFEQLQFFTRYFDNIISMINDRSYSIKDAVFTIIELIFTYYKPIATDVKYLSQLAEVVNNTPSAPEILAIRLCKIVYCIGKNYKDVDRSSSPLESVFPVFLDSMLRTLQREDAPSTTLGNHCTNALIYLILAAPDSMEVRIAELLNDMNMSINQILTQSTVTPHEYIQMKIQYFCNIIWASVRRLKLKIEAYSDTILKTLFSLLEKKSIIFQQDGLIALSEMINVLGNAVQPSLPQIIHVFELSQKSKIKEVVEMSATIILCIYKLPELYKFINPESTQMIINTLLENINDENMHIDAKIQILLALSQIVKDHQSNLISFFPVFVSQISKFQSIFLGYNLQMDDDEICLLCTSILRGYGSLLYASKESDYLIVYVKNFRQVIKFFEKLSNLQFITDYLKKEVISYLDLVVSTISLKVNAMLHRRCIISIMEGLATDKNEEIRFHASILLNRINDC